MTHHLAQANEPLGVFVVADSMSRGFDMKKVNDAVVHIVIGDKRIPYSEIQQKAGRGCRNQGKATCVLWTTDVPESADPRTQYEKWEKDPS
jgi:hypothetical protein